MKTYIGTKLVKARPMNRADYNTHCGRHLSADENGEDSGMLVHDGYISWSPIDVFNRAYRPVDGMTFGQALEALKIGKSVARTGWNGKGLRLMLQVPDEHSKMTLPYIYMQYPDTKASDTAPESHLSAKVPWLASQTDMLSEDWGIVG